VAKRRAIYSLNLEIAACRSSASFARLWLDEAISSIEASCSSVAADTFRVSAAFSLLILLIPRMAVTST